MSKTSTYQTAVLQYRTAQIATERLHDPSLTPEANSKRKRDARAAARAKLREAIPQRPDGSDPRGEVLDALTPTTADQIAVQGREREKFEALLARGAHLSQVIAQADERRQGAILDWLETSDEVQESPDPQAAQAELRVAVFDRLATLGHPDAVTAAATVADQEVTTAWADALEALAIGDEPGGTVQTAIFRNDPEAYRATFGADLPAEDGRTLAAAKKHAAQDAAREQAMDRQLDRTTGAGQIAGPMEAGQ